VRDDTAETSGGGGAATTDKISLRDLLESMVKVGASDLHLTAGVPPQIRVDGRLKAADGAQPLTATDTQQLAYSVLTVDQRQRFETSRELDLSFGIKGVSRFRANVFMQRGVVSMAIRQIPYTIKPLAELGLPPVVKEFIQRPKGLVLVTGPTGSGKSTSLAAMIDQINGSMAGHIITIEDPIEFIHTHKRSIVNQREVGGDTEGFAQALKYILRQDPDVILIGEMRDLETIQAALNIAETGHLVFATLHTNSTYESINRIVDCFPSDQHQQVLSQLAFVLQGVITQQLLPRAHGRGRTMCAEVLVCTQAVRAVIREGKIHQVYSLMQAGQRHGMQTMNQGLYAACVQQEITREQALERSTDAQELEQMFQKRGFEQRPRGSRTAA
jgi:twitching motility protein PilT